MPWSRAAIVAKTQQQTAPVAGRLTALVVFARFSDEDGTTAAPEYGSQIFNPDLPGSLTHFYDEMSGGRYSLDGSSLPRWYTASQPASSYVADEDGKKGGYGRFVHEILQRVDGDVDFSQFDNDGPDGEANSGDDDGAVDFLFVVMQSTPRRFIVTQATGISGIGLENDFVTHDLDARGRRTVIRVDGTGGSIQRGRTAAEAIGSMAHEFGHALGLPDLFDTDFTSEGGELDPEEDSAGIGYWGLMGHGARGWGDAGGPNPLCAWSLEQLGWLGVASGNLVDIEVGSKRELRFEKIADGGVVYRVPGADSSLYYLIEYRTPESSHYERHLPGAGILIWRIDEGNRGTVNNDERAKLVDLVSADGLYGDAGFPAGKQPLPQAGRDNLDFWAHDAKYVREHAGNLGDATDVHAEERAEYSVATNPASPPGMSLSRVRIDGSSLAADLDLRDRRWAGNLTGSVTWSDSVFVVGDVSVGANSVLTITGGTVIVVGPDVLGSGRDEARSEITARGLIRTSGSGHVLFTSAASDPAPGDWFGITAGAFGSLALRSTSIEYAVTGIAVAPLSSIAPSADLFLNAVKVRHVSESGIVISTDGDVELDEVAVIGAPGAGAVLEGLGRMVVTNSKFEANGGDGLRRRGGFVECVGNSFSYNAGSGDANVVMGSNVTGSVTDCRFEGGVGVLVKEQSRLTISENELRDHTVAIASVNSTPSLERNLIHNSKVAFSVSGTAVPARILLNSIEEPSFLVANESQQEVFAARNWWGSVDESWIVSRMSGQVAWHPALNFDPTRPILFELSQNRPNPFNASTVIDYTVGLAPASIDPASTTTLEIRSISGGFVRRLIEKPANPGIFSVTWDGKDEAGFLVATGVYLYELKVGPIVFGRKLLVLR